MANILSMSVSTVSRALSDHPDISKETKRKVREVSELYNYTPDLRARYLRTKSSGLVALILPEYHMFFIPTLMKTISELVNKAGYSLLTFQSDNSYEKELEIIEYCNQISVDGILLSIGYGFHHQAELEKLSHDGAPIVLLDHILDHTNLSTIGIEGYQVAYDAVKYLKSKGHKKIGGLFSASSQRITSDRQSGFVKACEDLALNYSVLEIFDFDNFDQAFLNYLKSNKDLTAIFTMSDLLMIHCHSGLQKNGFKIPDDISLLAISDGIMPKILTPAIHHIHHSPELTGIAAVEILMKVIKEKSFTDSIRLECTLMEHHSVKNLN